MHINLIAIFNGSDICVLKIPSKNQILSQPRQGNNISSQFHLYKLYCNSHNKKKHESVRYINTKIDLLFIICQYYFSTDLADLEIPLSMKLSSKAIYKLKTVLCGHQIDRFALKLSQATSSSTTGASLRWRMLSQV